MQYVKVTYTNGNEKAVKLSTHYNSIWDVKACAFNDKHVTNIVAISHDEYIKHTTFYDYLTTPILGVSVTTTERFSLIKNCDITHLQGYYNGQRIEVQTDNIRTKQDVKKLRNDFAQEVINQSGYYIELVDDGMLDVLDEEIVHLTEKVDKLEKEKAGLSDNLAAVHHFAEKDVKRWRTMAETHKKDADMLSDRLDNLIKYNSELRKEVSRTDLLNKTFKPDPRACKPDPCACSCKVNPLALMPFAVILGLIVTAIVLH